MSAGFYQDLKSFQPHEESEILSFLPETLACLAMDSNGSWESLQQIGMINDDKKNIERNTHTYIYDLNIFKW